MMEGIVTPIASSSGLTARGSGGRSIGYAEFGDPNGKPVMLFHGFGDSRLTRYPDDALTARLGIRLITFDRPGIGLTDPMKELTILDRTDDAVDLANSLGLGDIAVLGWSGGAPYALAAAGCMAGKVRRVAIVSGFGPFERPGFKRLAPREIKRVMTILKVAPWMANVMATESQKQLEGNATGAMETSRGLGGSADAGVLNMSGVRANVTSGAEEAFRQGPAGVANDMLLLFRFKWGFNPEDVHTPVDLWYGDSDQMTPPDVGRGLASVLPQPRLRMVPGAGHLLYLRNWEEILRSLVADEAPATTTTFQAITPVAPVSPVIESLAAASLSDAVPAAAQADLEPAAEPVVADGDVLGSTPAWSWMQQQPAAASQQPVEAPASAPEEREPVAYQPEPAEAAEVRAVTPRPRPAASGSDQLARLRALGFVVDEPATVGVAEEVVEPEADAAEAEPEAEAVASEPEAETVEAEPEAEAVEAEPEAEAAHAEPEAEAVEAEAVEAEPEAEAVEAEPEAERVEAEPEAEVVEAEPEAEAAEAEPEAEAALPQLTVVEPPVAAKGPSLNWQPVDVPGLTIGRPRVVAPVEPATELPGPTTEPEPIESVAATGADPETEVAAPELAAAESEITPFDGRREAAIEPEPAVEAPAARLTAPVLDSAEAQRLRAAGFLVSEPEPVAAQETAAEMDAGHAAIEEPAMEYEAAAAEVSPVLEISPADDVSEERAAGVAADALERLRAAGFAPSEPEEAEAVADEDVELTGVAATPEEPTQPDAANEGLAAGAEPTPVAEVEQVTETGQVDAAVAESEPVEAEPAAEAEPLAEAEPAAEAEQVEPTVAEVEPVAEVKQVETVVDEPEPQPEHAAPEVATELEDEAAETVLVSARESHASEQATEDFTPPQSEPSPGIAASAAEPPAAQTGAGAHSTLQMDDQPAVETGVGWVETIAIEADKLVAPDLSHAAEPDMPPEPMVSQTQDEPAEPPARDETLERLRAAGFLVGEPRRG